MRDSDREHCSHYMLFSKQLPQTTENSLSASPPPTLSLSTTLLLSLISSTLSVPSRLPSPSVPYSLTVLMFRSEAVIFSSARRAPASGLFSPQLYREVRKFPMLSDLVAATPSGASPLVKVGLFLSSVAVIDRGRHEVHTSSLLVAQYKGERGARGRLLN